MIIETAKEKFQIINIVEYAISKISNIENLNSTNTKFLKKYDRKQASFEKKIR